MTKGLVPFPANGRGLANPNLISLATSKTSNLENYYAVQTPRQGTGSFVTEIIVLSFPMHSQVNPEIHISQITIKHMSASGGRTVIFEVKSMPTRQ